VTEVLRMESDVVTMQDIFRAKPIEDDSEVPASGSNRLLGPLLCTGIIPGFIDKLAGNGVHLPPQFFQTEQRAGGYGSFGRPAS
jgi:hypothetical protein